LSFDSTQQSANTARPVVVPGGWARVSGLHTDRDVTVYLRQPDVNHGAATRTCDGHVVSEGQVVSTASLLGRRLIGRCAGDTVTFDAAGERVHLTIRDVGSSVAVEDHISVEQPTQISPLVNP
jgi:transcription elongation GreA/GreB family factor